jgi:hypothetical protein
MADPIAVRRAGNVLTLTIARPEKRNALSAEVVELLPFHRGPESLSRHLVDPEKAQSCSWIQGSVDLYEHALTVAMGAYPRRDSRA